MREIKFRFYSKELKKHIPAQDVGLDEMECFIKGEKLYDLIVEQYTDLKDRNGTEIFEGDVMEVVGYNKREGQWEKRFEVIWDKKDASFCLRGENGELYAFFGHLEKSGRLSKGIVVGNIYETKSVGEKVL